MKLLIILLLKYDTLAGKASFKTTVPIGDLPLTLLLNVTEDAFPDAKSIRDYINERFKAKKAEISVNGFFDQIRDKIVKNVNIWDNDYKASVLEALGRGKAVLNTQDELDRYIFAYGNMHQAKLNCAFKTIDDLNRISKKEISIIDYGCGQGVGSIVLIDYLNSLPLYFSISNVKLIEPSKIALQTAQKYIKSCVSTDIELINSDINEIKPDNLKTNDKNVTFHIFSNILDVEEVDIESIFENVNKSITGVNYVVCVSPYYPSSNQKLDKFIECFKDNLQKNITIISERSKPTKPWTAYEKVFKVTR